VRGAVLTTNRFGLANSAYFFDGVASRIEVPDTFFNPATPAWSISVWITTDGGPYTDGPSWQTIFSKGTHNGEVSLQINAAGQIFFSPHLANYPNDLGPMSPVRSNSVTHVVAVYEPGKT